ncbi:MAG: phage portal protein [Gaiellaceae bacterium]
MSDEESARQAITRLADRLLLRRPEMQRNHEYFRGQQPLRFASKAFSHYFGHQYAEFADNWCEVVAVSPPERLQWQGIRLPDAKDGKADKDTWRVWVENDAEVESGLAFLNSGIASTAFMHVWGNPDDESTPEICFEDAREAIVEYAPGSRRKRRVGLKMWADDWGGWEFATVEFPDYIWKYKRKAARKVPEGLQIPGNVVYGSGQWIPRDVEETGDDVWPLPNPLKKVPLVELPNRPLLAEHPLSDIGGVRAMQDAINLLWAHLFTDSDFAALPQRILLGADVPKIPVLDDSGKQVGERKVSMEELRQRRMLWVPSKDAKVAEWSPANLDMFTGVLGIAVEHVAAQTRTPPYYLVGKMINIGPEALKASETGQVKKCEEKQLYYGSGIRDGQELVALAQGDDSKAKAVRSATMLWKDAEMRSEAQLVDGIVKLRSIGFPFQWCAERYGLDPVEVSRVLGMREDEQRQAMLAGLLNPPPPDENDAPAPEQLPAAAAAE